MKGKLAKKVSGFLTVLVVVTCSNAFAIDAPVLTVATSGLSVSLSWTSVSGATDYTLYYAPYPYTGPDTISNVGMHTDISFTATLWDGASYYVAVTASDDSIGGESGYSNIGMFTIASSCNINELDFCATSNDCVVAGGYWWDDNTCLGVPESETVVSAGQVWMDRNLGASRVATSPADSLAFGDLYQWGRGSDGHEKRTSGITHVTSSEDTPGHSNYIAAGDGNNWLVPQNDNLWQGLSGVNNPCPSGFRVPTKTEWETELSSWGSNDITGAFLSPLHLVLGGNRDDEDGSICDFGLPGEGSEIVGSCDSAFDGDYWSSTVSDSTSLNEVNHGSNAYILGFASSDTINFGSTSSTEVAGTYGVHRADGYSVRCIKD